MATRAAGFTTAVVILMSVPASAFGPDDVVGRWKATNIDFVFDISRCGARYCGQRVERDRCGGIILTLDKTRQLDGAVEFAGKLDLPGEASGLEASAFATTDDSVPTLQIDAYNPSNPPTIEHRTLPFEAHFERIGGATCHPGASS